jgi:pimeloyl-ACP methyl ester carboxylesterase
MGFSLGGALALAAGAEAERLGVASLCVVAAPHGLTLTFKAVLLELASVLRPAFYAQIPFYGLYGLLPAAGDFKRHLYPLRFEGRKAGLDYMPKLAALFAKLDLPRAAPRVTVPTLLIYGGRDRIAPVEHGRELEQALPRAKLLVLPGETHFTTLLSRKTTASVLAFLRET